MTDETILDGERGSEKLTERNYRRGIFDYGPDMMPLSFRVACVRGVGGNVR